MITLETAILISLLAFGIFVALFGIILFSVLFFLSLWDKLDRNKRRQR